MMVDSSCVLTGHAGPVLVRPKVCVLTARNGNLIPELGPHPGECLGLSHGQRYLHPLHQHLDVLWVGEVSRVEDWLVVGVATPEEDPAPGLGSEEHGDD